ncbi:MAG TPA: HD domain-containing protein [Spirochaetia bacterium]|nr:HD domain-containing protein [Spirochaetales bacterium]HRY79907.1 HD domain-containing protein [Spirochaetia bacterium]
MKRKAGFPEDLLFGAAPAGTAPAEGPTAAAAGPASPGDPSPEEALLRAYLRVLALKRLYRQGWLKRGVPEERCESVADHSFGTAVLALFLAGREPFRDADPGRTCRMALAHELGEVYAGDITPVDGISKEEKYRMERESLLRVLEGAPGSGEILALWEEFEEGASPEARLLRRLDRLEMGIQAAVYRAEGFPRMEEFLESARKAAGEGLPGEVLAMAVNRPSSSADPAGPRSP